MLTLEQNVSFFCGVKVSHFKTSFLFFFFLKACIYLRATSSGLSFLLNGVWQSTDQSCNQNEMLWL